MSQFDSNDTTLGFPREYLQPMHTAVGAVYPPPKLRKLLEDMDNIQKRMALTKQMAHPFRLQKAYAKKEDREAKFKQLQEDFHDQEKELEAVQEKLKKTPLEPVHFVHPEHQVSYCCKAPARTELREVEGEPQTGMTCLKCGRATTSYRRLDKEDWAAEYSQVVVQKRIDLQEDRKKIETGEKRKQIIDKPVGYVPYANG